MFTISEKWTETYKTTRERWLGDIRDWSLPEYITLNPMDESQVEQYFSQQSF